MVLKNKNNSKTKSIGQIFTPNFIAKFMVKNSLRFVEILKKDNPRINNNQDIKVLEPSVGEGIFLKHFLQNNLINLTAYEIDAKLKDHLLNIYPKVKFNFKNVLGSRESEKFDLIIGNPPYLGQNYNANVFQGYVKKYPICAKYFVGNMDLFYFFIHFGILKLNPGGILSFITTNYWITKSKKTGIKLLKPHVLNECFLLQYVDLSNLKLFNDAKGQHNCIFVLKKKTEEEKTQNVNKTIEIIQIGKKPSHFSDNVFNRAIFKNLINEKESRYIYKYKSAITNNDLERQGSWNLIYPKEVKKVVKKIEKKCLSNGKISLLKDYFIIRNGLIFIKDDIFILNNNNINKNLKIKNNDFFVKINNEFVKLSKKEKERLKKIYKSKFLRSYGYGRENNIRYAIYFNKNEFVSKPLDKRNRTCEVKYPVLTTYLKQFEKELREILINAKENPDDLYFPRRGAFIRRLEKDNEEIIIDLESLYENDKKIFLKYISNENIFGFSDSSYFATSDTYFLWPKNSKTKLELDYTFLLAYLNSKLVYFLFKAKNISIKRSKTKLEYGLPVPNINNFNSKKELSIITLIKLLTRYLIEINTSNDLTRLKSLKLNIKNFKKPPYWNQDKLFQDILYALEKNDNTTIQKTIDKLFFQIFDLREKEIDSLIKKYYF
ncbi:MAG: Eco57I restriction-modification methylase domain-containing protein [Promethearchaeota archaeon]